jgi:hypothetical protein
MALPDLLLMIRRTGEGKMQPENTKNKERKKEQKIMGRGYRAKLQVAQQRIGKSSRPDETAYIGGDSTGCKNLTLALHVSVFVAIWCC